MSLCCVLGNVWVLIVTAVTLLILALIYCLKPKAHPIVFNGRHVIITGGSSGIGLSLAECLLKKHSGVTVTLVARNRDRLESVREALLDKTKCTPEQVQVYACDVTNYSDMERAVTWACHTSRVPVSVLICSAGIASHRLLQDTSSDMFKDIVNINTIGCFNAAKAVLPFMTPLTNADSAQWQMSGDSLDSPAVVAQRLRDDPTNQSKLKGQPSCICFISSQAGSIGIIGYTGYSSSKFALRGLAESLQMELRPHNVMVTLTHPPDTETPSLVKENEERSPLLKEIAETACAWSSDMVAHKVLFDISNNVFLSHFGVIGWLLSIGTASCAPVHSISQFIVEILLAPVARLVALFVHYDFDAKIRKAFKNESLKKQQ